jgi:hypothetical protein
VTVSEAALATNLSSAILFFMMHTEATITAPVTVSRFFDHFIKI